MYGLMYYVLLCIMCFITTIQYFSALVWLKVEVALVTP